ncbi:glycosyltransferase family 2 protein [Rufibacter ruber]|uniref:glycosyltransferase family 2 protein n=1 Tax=Rufibacter ruber TaxID=1783499 RepID=UPI0008302F5E|nr:glycosyltransferase [Rufibacter ruber]
MNAPLVSVICLCYNHGRFLRQALDSVLGQTYPNLEILVVDDLSSDDSVAIIEEYVQRYPFIQFLRHRQNKGNCYSFNEAFRWSKGDYVIDFATDDVLHPERVTRQVAAFAALPPDYGVLYTDADLIDEASHLLGRFYQRSKDGALSPAPAQGDVFAQVLSRYFICPPTVMVKRRVLEELNGYDASLAYEDFDFWVRSSRNWKFHFLDQVLCQRRMHPHSLSRQLYKKGDQQLASTIQVIRKAQQLVQNPAERKALQRRIRYEARHAYLTANYRQAAELLSILQEEGGVGASDRVLQQLVRYRVPLQFVRKWYHRWRYGRSGA